MSFVLLSFLVISSLAALNVTFTSSIQKEYSGICFDNIVLFVAGYCVQCVLLVIMTSIREGRGSPVKDGEIEQLIEGNRRFHLHSEA